MLEHTLCMANVLASDSGRCSERNGQDVVQKASYKDRRTSATDERLYRGKGQVGAGPRPRMHS